MRANLILLRNKEWSCAHLPQEFLLTFALPRSDSNHHLIEDDADGKDIALGGVDVPHERFNWHV
jgi:hypothetical protein